MSPPPPPRRRDLARLGGAAVLGLVGTRAATAGRPALTEDTLDVNVREFGAVGDGRTDDTAAFNRATDAVAVWSPTLQRRIAIPPGTYRLAGTVFVRKGQELVGAGQATCIDARGAVDATIVLGCDARGQEDPGGAPVRASKFRAIGSAPREPFLLVRAQGFSLSDLFLTAVGTGIRIEGADGVISDVQIDQALSGVVLHRSQNILVNNLYVYLAHYALTLTERCANLSFANTLFCYCRYAAVLMAEGGADLRAIGFTGCQFVLNEPFATFTGFVQCRASRVEALFTSCHFANWRGHAVEQSVGADVDLAFQGCVFDRARPNPVYTQSPDAKVLVTGSAGRFRFEGCSFRHLTGPIATVRAGTTAVTLAGGSIEACLGPVLAVDADNTAITIRDVAGFPVATPNGWALPTWPGAAWRVHAALIGGNDAVAIAIVTGDGVVTTLAGAALRAFAVPGQPSHLLMCSADAHARTIGMTASTFP